MDIVTTFYWNHYNINYYYSLYYLYIIYIIYTVIIYDIIKKF